MKKTSTSSVAAVGLLAIMFVAGALSGGFLVRSSEPPPTTVRSDFFAAVLDSLDLRDEQRAELASILSEREADTALILQEAVRRLQARTDSTANELRSRLDPDQAVRFDQLIEQELSNEMPRRRRSGGG